MRNAIICDLDRCTGCLTCAVACKMENKVPIGSYNTKVVRIGPTPRFEGARFPDVQMYFLPLMCQHCGDPECIRVCPTGASYKAFDGAVLIDAEKCNGCKLCIGACPYGTRYYNPRRDIVEKCTMCNHIVAQDKEPMCVSQCVGRALVFGDLDDPKSPASVMIASAGEHAHSLLDTGNHPTFKYILRKTKWLEYPMPGCERCT